MEEYDNPAPKLSLAILAIFIAVLGVAIWRDYDNVKSGVRTVISTVFPTLRPTIAPGRDVRGPGYFGSRK